MSESNTPIVSPAEQPTISLNNEETKSIEMATSGYISPVADVNESLETGVTTSSAGSFDSDIAGLPEMNLDEQKVYSNLAKLNSFFMNDCSKDKIKALTDSEIDALIDKDIEHVFANMYHAAKIAGKNKITDVYEAKRDFLLYMYNSSIMDIELTLLNQEFAKLQKEFANGHGFKYDVLLPMIKERMEKAEDSRVKLRLQQIYDAFISSLTLEAFLPKNKRNKRVNHNPNDEKFKARYEKEKEKFMDILEKDSRTYIIHSPRIEEDMKYIMSKNFPDGEMDDYVIPFLYTLYREINKAGKVSTTSAVFLIFFLSNVNSVMRDIDIEYAGQFVDNIAAFMQKQYIIEGKS